MEAIKLALSRLSAWWRTRPLRERSLLLVTALVMLSWSGYRWGWIPFLAWRTQIQATHQQAVTDLQWLESQRPVLDRLYRDVTLPDGDFAPVLQQLLSRYAADTQMRITTENAVQNYHLSWRGQRAQGLFRALERATHRGAEISSLEYRRNGDREIEIDARITIR